MKYIAYGSNMSVEQMKYRCPDAVLIGVGKLENARLEFFLHATVERSEDRRDCVPVAVWEISDADERRLDHYEGWPDYYVKAYWPVWMKGGDLIDGLIYLMKRKRAMPPAADYSFDIRDAYEHLGLRSEIKRVLEPAFRRSFRANGRDVAL